MRQSLRVIHGEPLDLEELNSTKDLVMAHDKLQQQIANMNNSLMNASSNSNMAIQADKYIVQGLIS
jgi:hypothetical protein